MKRVIYLVVKVVLICLLVVFSLMGCTKTSTETAVDVTTISETSQPVETTVAETTSETVATEKTTIVITSYRTDDIDAMAKIDAAFMEKYPNITVKFDPIKNTEYFGQLQTSLETQSDNYDIIGMFPFSGVNVYHKNGYTLALNNLLKNLSNFPKDALAKYSSGDDIVAIPIAAVSHGIYYNKDIFAKYNLKEPETWADFIAICDTLKENGETVLAQGAVDAFTAGEHFFDNIGPNFFGGEDSRQKLMAGEIKFTDPKFIKALEVQESLIPYFVDGYQGIDYVGMQQLFKTGQAAMFISGSWEIGGLKAEGLNFGWFAPPVEKASAKMQYCFLDTLGYGISKYSKNQEAAAIYLDWMSTEEANQILMENIPGFYNYVPGDYSLDPSALKMLDVVNSADLIERLMLEKLSDESPAGTELLNTACQKLLLKEYTPQQAAEYVQENLETWYPFK